MRRQTILKLALLVATISPVARLHAQASIDLAPAGYASGFASNIGTNDRNTAFQMLQSYSMTAAGVLAGATMDAMAADSNPGKVAATVGKLGASADG